MRGTAHKAEKQSRPRVIASRNLRRSNPVAWGEDCFVVRLRRGTGGLLAMTGRGHFGIRVYYEYHDTL